MLYRKRHKDIVSWIRSGDKALLVTGARQIGKTFLIEETLKEENADFVSFNLIEQPEVVELFRAVEKSGIEKFLSRLSLLTEHKLVKGSTILFFDEIQQCRDIVTKVKFLVREGSFKYVFSGSLLGVELAGIKSAPVGFMNTLEMYPMDFEEFARALGLSDEVFQSLKAAFDNKTAVDEFVHDKLMEAFYNYLVIGGMPEAVNEYVTNHDYNRVMSVHNAIIPQYKLDFTKYEMENRKLRLLKTYELIPSELNEKNKRYTFARLDKNLKMERHADSFEWLVNAGAAIPVYNVTEPKIPLRASEKSNLFKLFLSDVGLLSTMYGRGTIIKTLNGERDVNYGAIFENAVAQELHSHGYSGYYFNSKKQGEIDFVIEYKNKCLPIEVKSGKDYKVHSALNNVLEQKSYGIDEAFVLCGKNLEVREKVTYLPIYMVMFIDERSEPIPHYDALSLMDL